MTDDLTLPEPPDGTVLYWPETEDNYSTVVVRDDVAAMVLFGEPTRHWFTPNMYDDRNVGPLTWAKMCTDAPRRGVDLTAAIRFTPASPGHFISDVT
jgi:hypothetical protein